MSFYTVKLPKRFFIVTLCVFCVAIWTLYNNLPIKTRETFGEIKPIYEGPKDKKMMAFTCNVAWGNEFIPDLLEVFEQNDVKATFFVEGRWAEKYPDLLKMMSSKGHEIGNHGYSHAHHAKLSLEQNINEIKKAEDALYKVIGKKPVLFAPPYGEYSDLTVKASDSLGYKLIMWTIDTIDWKKPGVDYIINKVVKNADNGKIVLMHPTEDAVKAMPIVIKQLKEQGYKITTVSELLSNN